MLSEKAINIALGRALSKRRRAWEGNGVLQVEPLQSLQGKGRPDILVMEPGLEPVVIESEVAPAPSVEKDAEGRLGAKTAMGDEIRSVVAVRFPGEWRDAVSERALDEAVESQLLEWALWTQGDDGVVQRWPKTGWVRGNISQLAFVVYQSSLAGHRAKRASEILASAVMATAETLQQLSSLGYESALQGIAGVLHQTPNKQTWGMAGLILANALAFHELLARRGNLAHIPTPSEVRVQYRGEIKRSDVLLHWGQILDVNYLPIFAIAKDILSRIPEPFANKILTVLDSAASSAGLRALLPSHDLLSETFQRMIADRKKLASFYTLPETAALLTALALSPDHAPNGCSWDDTESLKNVVIADYACGTGTLLASAYRRMAWLHELAGGTAAALHEDWMSRSLWGIDVLPAAVHLTATILSSIHPLMHYSESQIYIAPYGPVEATAGVSLGSLDLLDDRFEITDLYNPASRVASAKVLATHLRKEVQRADLCIMNPPYTRNTNHEGKRASDALPAFAAFGLSAEAQKAMGARLKELGRRSFAHGNAGIASHFLVLADKMTKPGGTMALVLPLAFLMGASWENARKTIAQRYSDLIVVTISGIKDREIGFSADTGMGECLLVAHKVTREGPSRVTMVSLDSRPDSALLATLVGEQVVEIVTKGAVPRLEEAPHGGAEIRFGGERIGTVLSVRTDWGPGWVGACVADYSLVQCGYHLAGGRVWLPGVLKSEDTLEVPMVPLGAIARLGPLHRDINGTEMSPQGYRRGPFDVVPLVPGEVPTHPVLWSHDAKREITMEFEPDCKGILRADAHPAKVEAIVQSASNLHINLDWRFNSQPLQAQWTNRPSLGGSAWPSILVHPHDPSEACCSDKERLQSLALLLWLNSAPGLLLRWVWSSLQQKGRGRITREVLPTMPILDVRSLSDAQLELCEGVFQSLRQKPLLPAHKISEDAVRAELDRRFLGDVLGWPRDWFDPYGPLDLLRRKLSAEPSIHGHKKN